MSDTEVPADDPATEPDPVSTEPVEPPEGEPESSNAEAAKWRKQFREAEQQRDALAAQVETLQRQHIEASLSRSGVKPAALWAVTQLADLLAEDGTVDTDKVAAAIETARDQLGIQPIGKGTYVPGLGGPPAGNPKPENAFADAFKPHRSR